MTDREKLVELLAEYAGYFGVEAKHLADHLIANGVTVQEWTSVKDRLPVTDGRQIATANPPIGCPCPNR